jgi:hypothetical protein
VDLHDADADAGADRWVTRAQASALRAGAGEQPTGEPKEHTRRYTCYTCYTSPHVGEDMICMVV